MGRGRPTAWAAPALEDVFRSWKFNTLTVEVMPVEALFLGLNTIWFDHTMVSSVDKEIDGETIRIVSGTTFVATKQAYFQYVFEANIRFLHLDPRAAFL